MSNDHQMTPQISTGEYVIPTNERFVNLSLYRIRGIIISNFVCGVKLDFILLVS